MEVVDDGDNVPTIADTVGTIWVQRPSVKRFVLVHCLTKSLMKDAHPLHQTGEHNTHTRSRLATHTISITTPSLDDLTAFVED